MDTTYLRRTYRFGEGKRRGIDVVVNPTYTILACDRADPYFSNLWSMIVGFSDWDPGDGSPLKVEEGLSISFQALRRRSMSCVEDEAVVIAALLKYRLPSAVRSPALPDARLTEYLQALQQAPASLRACVTSKKVSDGCREPC